MSHAHKDRTCNNYYNNCICYNMYTIYSGIYVHLVSLWKWRAMVLISCPSYTLIESLANWLPEADCENMLSITSHGKYTQSFNTPKCPIEKCIAESTGWDSLRMLWRAKTLSFETLLASFKSLRIALSCGSCESVELA